MTHVTCRLTAKNRDQLRNSTLGNRVWATITFTAKLPNDLDRDLQGKPHVDCIYPHRQDLRGLGAGNEVGNAGQRRNT